MLTERVLSRQSRLAEFAALVHERTDGSEYPRGLSGAAIPFCDQPKDPRGRAAVSAGSSGTSESARPSTNQIAPQVLPPR
ncbi:hypothetical protein GLP40_22685 [Nocardia sp. CT2-14]|uniref:Uncharacterized protein n=1 Tax=Nocardia aurantiaca TaxID=2675850 RepID=A0A6I3KXM0_9NOCA|nr:hypothetical protein [Nocardia aurantiaca]